MNVPKPYWGDALLTAAYLKHRMPSRVLNFENPIDVLSPSLSSSPFVLPPRVFGCVFLFIFMVQLEVN